MKQTHQTAISRAIRLATILLTLWMTGSIRVAAWTNPMVLPGLENRSLGDPYIMKYRGYYYLYVSAGDRNIYCWRSKDLTEWSTAYVCCTDETTAVAYAPEVIYWNGRFYMCTSPRGGGHYLLTSDSPLGPFVHQTGNLGRDIDGSMFVDDDGSWYFYHANNGGIRGCAMPTHLSLADDVDLGCCMSGQWTEGPCVFKRNNLYYLLYTGNHVWTDAYRIDYAISGSGPLAGFRPQASQNPILIDAETPTHKALGHGTAFVGPDLDTYFFCYHNLQDNKARRLLNFERIGWCGDKLIMTGPTDWEQDLPLTATSDYFEREALGADWTTDDDGLWQIADADHLRASSAEGRHVAIFDKAAHEDYTAEFTARSADGLTGSFGAIFSYRDADNYAEALIHTADKRLEVAVYADGAAKSHRSFSLPADFDPAAWHAIRIEKNGRITRIFVDDMRKYLLTAQMGGGKIGYVAQSAPACFSYIALSPYVDGSAILGVSLPIPGTIAASMCTDKSADVRPTAYSLTPGTAYYMQCSDGSTLTYQVNIRHEGPFNLGLRYRSSAVAHVRLLIDGHPLTSIVELPSTRSSVVTQPLSGITLPAGRHQLTIEVVDGHPLIYEYSFKPGVAHPRTMADNFDQGFSPDWGYREGNWTIADGQLESTGGYGKMLMGGYGDIHMTDYTVECDVSYPFGEMNGGLLVRTTNASTGGADDNPVLGTDFLQGYVLLASATSVTLGKHNFGWQALATVSHTVNPAVPHHMKVEVKGATISCYIDDMQQPVLIYTDTQPFLTGRAGFRAHNSRIRFDNFVVTPAEGAPSAVVAPHALPSPDVHVLYNLQGQRRDQQGPLGHGVYIAGGRKVVR